MKTEVNVSTASIAISARENIANPLPFANYHTLPIATFRNKSLFLAVLFGRGEFVDSETGYSIWRPHLMAYYSVTTGFLEELLSIGNPPLETDLPLGKGLSPIDKFDIEYVKQRARYCDANDKLLDAVVNGEIPENLIANVRKYYYECSELGLRPYFEKIFVSK